MKIKELQDDFDIEFNRAFKDVYKTYNLEQLFQILNEEITYLFQINDIDVDEFNISNANIKHIFDILKTELFEDDYDLVLRKFKRLIKFYISEFESYELFEICAKIKRIFDYVDTNIKFN